jgi:F420-dependent oxidoreductase-like protein
VRIGLSIARVDWPGGPAAIRPNLIKTARAAEDGGLSSLWVMDHFFQIPGLGEPHEPMLEGYTALGFLAAATERISLGTLVTGVTYRNPAILAKTATTLDVLAGGRTYLGIGAAWFEHEHESLGVRFPPVKERFERLEETLKIVNGMWSESEDGFDGVYYQPKRLLNVPAPVSSPRPKILIGGMGEQKTLLFVARYADACNLFDGGDEMLTHKLGILRAHCESEGRDYAEVEKTAMIRVAGDAKVGEVAERCEQVRALGIDHAITAVPPGSGDEFLELLSEVASATVTL